MRLRDEAAALAAQFDRERFIAFRTVLVQRGIHDPLLMRFDSHTVAPVGTETIVEHLRAVAETLPE
jgi:hypothetical protein